MWAKYYTPKNISELMIEEISLMSPQSAVDICVGSWNLLGEVASKWSNLEIHGVDTDIKSKIHKPYNTNHRFFHSDGRQFALECLNEKKKYSLVLANPPFGMEHSQTFGLYQNLPGYFDMKKRALSRVETTMLLANLSLIEEGGTMVAIVPNTIITGDWAQCLREYIGKYFNLETIRQLPTTVFGRDIKTSIIVVKNNIHNLPKTNVYVPRTSKAINIEWKLTKQIDKKHLAIGCWNGNETVYKKGNSIKVIRGGVSSTYLAEKGYEPVIHSTDIKNLKSEHWVPTRFFAGHKEHLKDKLLRFGDILMVRVGRNCGNVARISFEGALPVSDCLLIIRHNDTENQSKIWNLVSSSAFVNDLIYLRKGLVTSYLTSSDIYRYLTEKLNEEMV